MPTLRRSKSLNDKVTRQKHRSGDVVRDPRSPDLGGRTRTRTCLDNYQVLVHLRKQTDDKSRQLDLAYAYGANTSTILRPGGAQRASEGRAWSELYPSPSSTVSDPATGGPGPRAEVSGPPALEAEVRHRQPFDDRRSGQDHQRRVSPRQESFSGGQQDSSSTPQQAPKCPRPMSMFEARGGVPSVGEWTRKDQIIQNLLDSQKVVNGHNQQLRGKVDELECENARLREILTAHNIPHSTLPRALKLRPPHKGVPLSHDMVHSPSSETFAKFSSTLISPISETSVSGYGSLAGSGYGEGYAATLETRGGSGGGGGEGGRKMEETGPSAEAGGYNDDTLPLSEVSVERIGSEDSTLPSPISSGPSSRAATLNRQAGNGELQSLHKKLDQVLELERHRGGDRKKRIVELEQQVAELTEQRTVMLDRYKRIVEENEKLERREEHVQEELRTLLQQHGQTLQHVLRTELQHLQQELRGLAQDVRGQLEVILASLASATSSSGPADSERGSSAAAMDREVKSQMDKVVDLIGPEYLQLGRRLHVPPLELERIENCRDDFAHKTQMVLQSWLRGRQRQEEREREEREREERGKEGGGSLHARAHPPSSLPPPAVVLTQALRDMDKDVRLFNHAPICRAERQALRKCQQVAVDHVTGLHDLLDQLIILSELPPAGLTFVQEVAEESRERALCRLWHVLEYRGSGIISRLALALERSGHPHVSRTLTEELEMENSRLHSHYHHPLEEEDLHSPTASSLAARSLGSRPSPSPSRSRPSSATSSRSQPEAASFEAMGLPCRPLKKSAKMTRLPSHEECEIVWDRRAPESAPRGSSSPRYMVMGQETRMSKV